MKQFIAATAGLVAMLLASQHTIPVSPQTQPVIRIGIGAGDALLEGYYAQQMGFFKKAGLRVEIARYRRGATIMAGVSSDSIDIGISNVPNLVAEMSRGTRLVLLAGGALYSRQEAFSALCVPKASSLRTPSDLLGRTIAVAGLRDQSHLGALAWLDHNQVDTSKVKFIGVPFDEMTSGIDECFADAAVLTEPWLSAAVRSGKYRVLAKPYDAVAPEFLIGVWFTTSKWRSEHPDLAKRFVNAIYETARWANANHDQTATLLSHVSGIDLQTIRSMTRTPYATSLDPWLIQPQLDLAFKYHAIDHALNANDIIVKNR